MKTAMQELMNNLESIGIDVPNGVKLIFLEKEKEQIIKAHTNAYLIGEDDISVKDANKASEQYYNQTYNQNK